MYLQYPHSPNYRKVHPSLFVHRETDKQAKTAVKMESAATSGVGNDGLVSLDVGIL